MCSLSTSVITLQGIFGLLNGAISLLVPSVAAKNAATLGVDSIPAIHAIGLGSITIGAFYCVTAYRNDVPVMWMTVLGRVIAIPIFLKHGGPWANVAAFEGVCGGLTAAALVWERWRGKKAAGKSEGKNH
ncbi:hypothetical protein BGZ60DRAFT_408274 [Tricladium varicosporioides]|nr:hypothetical protein BGZ60DRAFT_408274 [Hymenoscyphus varicosporioides]